MANPSWYPPQGQASAPSAPGWTDQPLEYTDDAFKARRALEQQKNALQAQLAQLTSGQVFGSPQYGSTSSPQFAIRAAEEQLAAVESQLANLETFLPYLANPDLQGGRWTKAYEAELNKRVASGTLSEDAAQKLWASEVPKLQAETVPASGFAGLFGSRTLSKPALSAEEIAAGEKPAGQQPAGDEIITDGLFKGMKASARDELITSWHAQYPETLGLSDEDTVAIVQKRMNPGESETDARYKNALSASSEASTAKMLADLKQADLDRDTRAGVIGNYDSTGYMSPVNIQDNLNDPGVLGQIARAQLAQQTGGATSYQQQQDAESQRRWEATQAYNAQSFAADQAYRQQQLQQQMQIEQMQLEEQRREMAARIGQAVADMANQSYMNTLGQRLPAGTEYAPGFQAGGPMSALASMSGIGYTPQKIGVANPPTTQELMNTVQQAINGFH
jgi:hypothetical protein